MSDNRLTPEDVRAAAEVVEAFAGLDDGSVSEGREFVASTVVSWLIEYADRLEREQAVEAKRAKRIEEIAEWLCDDSGQDWTNEWKSTFHRSEWTGIAAKLLDRYPSLLDEPKES